MGKKNYSRRLSKKLTRRAKLKTRKLKTKKLKTKKLKTRKTNRKSRRRYRYRINQKAAAGKGCGEYVPNNSIEGPFKGGLIHVNSITPTEQPDDTEVVKTYLGKVEVEGMVPIQICSKCKSILDGNTRYKAAKELGWKTIKIEFIPKRIGVSLGHNC